MAKLISPGQVILTRMIPYPDGSMVQYLARPYLVIGVTSTHIETLIISSSAGKAHKLLYKSNFHLQHSIPPLQKDSFVKLDSYQKIEIAKLTDLRLASNGLKIDAGELSNILSLYRNYLP